MTENSEKRVFIRTYGCQMNVYDSERMSESLAKAGYAATDRAEDADLVVLNTCHIREKAAEKVYSEVGRMRQLREQRGKGLTIAVTGCVAQAEGAEIQRRAPAVDLVVGPQSYHRLPELVARAEQGETALVETDFPVESKFDHLPEERSAATGAAAFLTVQEGCDKFCSFCVVPYTRGAEESRPVDSVLAEAERLAGQGVREITLLGQNVNAYHGAAPNGAAGSWNLAQLLRALGEISGLERLRFTTSHPKDMDDDLFAAFAETPKLMPYLHLPVQSGSDPILKAMNRSHTAAEYLDIIERLRSIRPDMAISGDFIVGFPGESDADFADTLKIVTAVNYAQAYSFKYSPRPGTPAAGVEFHVPEEVKSERLEALQQLLNEQQLAFNQSCVGRRLSLLLERPGKEDGQLIGRSPYMQSVHVVAPQHRIGQIVDVDITAAGPNSLKGEITMAQHAA